MLPDEEVPEQEQAPSSEGVVVSEHPDHVEMPPEIQQKFNEVYRKLKDRDRALDDLRGLNTALYSKLEEIDTSRIEQTRQQTVAALETDIQKAMQRGDYARVTHLQGQLIDVKAEAKAREMARPKEVRTETRPSVDPSDQRVMAEWVNELTADGNFVRPWARDGHPLNAKMTSLGESLWSDPKYSGNVQDVLKELDRQMGLKSTPSRTGTTVLPANRGNGKAETKLTDAQAQQARKMGLTPERYAKQLAIIQKSR